MDKYTTQKYGFVEQLLFPKTFLNQSKLKGKLKGKSILITGASFGIGESISLLLAKTEANLILVGRTKEKLTSIQSTITKDGGSAKVFVADLRKDNEIQDLIQFLNKQRRLDVFINNAGKSIKRPILKSLDRFHDFSRTMAINYEAPVKLMLAILPMMKNNLGHVVNISALNVLMAPAPYWAAYQASKSAFDQWFRCVSPELENQGIAMTTIYLPLVRTRMIAPTQVYDKMPAMNPSHVARIVCKHLVTRKRTYRPWWSFFGIIGSVLFRKLWESMTIRFVRKKTH